MSERPWHKRYHSDALTGYQSLDLEERGAYTTLLDLMYDRGGPLEISDRLLAGYLNVSVRKATAVVSQLISKGKIERLEDGRLTNARFEKEIENALKTSRKLAENGSKGGRRRVENQKNDKENSGGDQAELEPGSSYIRYQKPELEKEEDICPKPPAAAPDLFVSDEAEKPRSKAKKPIGYTKDFEAFWSAYPTDPGMSKLKAFKAWDGLEPEERVRATATIPAFRKWVSKQGPEYRTLHAVRFITQKRFEGFSVTTDGTAEIKIDWGKRLSFARQKRQWDVRNWGPMPGQPGCTVPADVLLSGDGVGWSEYKP